MTRALTLVAGAVAGLAAWTTLGVLAVLSTDPAIRASAAVRVGLLPSPLVAILLIAAFIVAFWFRPQARAAVAVLGLVLLPWLPVDLPAAAMLWTGPMAAVVWIVWLVATAWSLSSGPPTWAASWFAEPRRAARVAFVIAAVAYVTGLALASRTVPGGDEPHYLIIARSLLADGDLRIENNHAQRDYLPYFEGELKPDFLKRSVDGAIYSIHAPGLPVLIAPALALFGHRGAMVFLALVSALGASLAWRLAWEVSRSIAAAWFGWAAIAFATPFFVHAFTIYPDAPAGVIVVFALLTFAREATAGSREPDAGPARSSIVVGLAGLALAALPWLHTRYALLAGALGLAIATRLLLARRLRDTSVFLAAPVVSATGWFLFFQTIYGSPDPAAPYGGYTQSSLAFVVPGLTGLLVDQQFGLIATAPVLAFAFAGLGMMLVSRVDPARSRELRSIALVLLLVCVPYALAASSYRMWWGGFSGPARFLVPLVPALAAPLAVLWTQARTHATRAIALWTLIWSVGFALSLVAEDGGRLAFSTRTAVAAWAERVAPAVDLAGGLPSFFRGPLPPMVWQALVWATALLAAWGALHLLERRPGANVGRLKSVWAPCVLALAAMAALSAAWRIEGVSPLRPLASQAALLRDSADFALRATVVAYEPAAGPLLRLRSRRSVAFPSLLRLSNEARKAPAPEEPAVVLPPLPAGDYQLRLAADYPPGELRLFVGRSGSPVATLDTRTAQDRALRSNFRLAAPVESLVVRGPLPSFRPGSVTIVPLAVHASPFDRLGRAARASKYGDFVVYFADEQAFPEGAGFWVRGGSQAAIGVQPPMPATRVTLFLRNAPVANRVSVTAGDWQETFDLAPGEERGVTLPSGEARFPTVFLVGIHPERGVRPADLEPGNRDLRLLGVWVEVRQ